MTWYITKKNDELCHFGIRGMKWGIRRFQNKDGSLTPAGKKREQNESSDDQRKKTMKKILVASIAAAAVVGAAYAGKKYFDSKKAQELMTNKLSSGDPRIGKGKGVLSGLFGKTQAQRDMRTRIKADKLKNKIGQKQGMLDRAKLSGMTNKKDIKKFMKGGSSADKLVKQASLRDRAYTLGIRDPKAIKKFISDNMK